MTQEDFDRIVALEAEMETAEPDRVMELWREIYAIRNPKQGEGNE